jgi:hypothetical protein
MPEALVTVIACRPYVRGAIAYDRGDPFVVPVLEALQLAQKGIVSLSKGRRPAPVERPRRRGRKSAA